MISDAMCSKPQVKVNGVPLLRSSTAMDSSKQHQILTKLRMSVCVCSFTMLHTAWAPRRRWLEAAFGRHRRWGPPTLLEGSLRQSSQSCTIQLPAWVEDKNLGSKMLPQESPANRRERCGDHMLAKPYFRHSRSCLSSRRGYINGWSSTICTQFGDGPSPITH